mgnify:CR=1 FL=1|jgi:hypothetical protein
MSKITVGGLIEKLLMLDKDSVICSEERIYDDDYERLLDTIHYTIINIEEKKEHFVNNDTGLEEFGKIVVFK